MPSLQKKIQIILIFFLILPLIGAFLFVPAKSIKAQFQSTGIPNVYEITEENIQEGDILISTQDKGLTRTINPYDNRLFGVLQAQPLMVFRRADNRGQPVVRYGTAQVNVTTLGGPINAGDYITSSLIAGKGQKADISGYVLGMALVPFGENEGEKIDYQTPGGETIQVASGKIPIALKIEFAELSTPRSTSRALSQFSLALFKNVQDPDKFVSVLRYLAAALTILISFAIGFLTFSRSIPKGIEAIGRNPLAEKAIIFSIVLQIILTIVTASIGIVAAVFILRL